MTEKAQPAAGDAPEPQTPPTAPPAETPDAVAPGEAHPPVGRPWLATLLAWLWPGLGHVYLRRWGRGLAFCVLLITLVVVGTGLEGRLWQLEGNPLAGWDGILATFLSLLSLGLGAPYLVLLLGDYAGDVAARGYEYGTAFLLTAALLNLLLVFDARDIALGRKP